MNLKSTQSGNALVDLLPSVERRRLLALCEPVELVFAERLCEQGEAVRYVYFPTGGFISQIARIDGRSRLELGMIGAEGMLGLSVLVGINKAPLLALVQGAGPALRIEADRFAASVARSPHLRGLLTRYLYVRNCQLAQMAGCTRFHLVEPRLACWLMMARDRSISDEFSFTQDFLARMLGVRRAGITRAARSLQRNRLISYHRGRLTILNEAGLRRASCECYAVRGKLYDQLLGKRT